MLLLMFYKARCIIFLNNMKKTVLIIGATGMLGNAQMTELSKYKNLAVFGTVRYFGEAEKYLPKKLLKNIVANIDVENTDNLARVLSDISPDVVINCVGLIKQAKDEKDIALNISLNSLFPHRLAHLCELQGSRLIHISTDCVFSGKKGFYSEDDTLDAEDVYGMTKALGEVGPPHLTIRTSILGHGLEGHGSLIDWFLSQKGKIKGFSKVIYSGFPTIEIARIIAEYIIPNEKLKGLYQVSSEPISKYELLKMVTTVYHKKIEINEYPQAVSDRSLNSAKFRKITGYKPPSWEQLIKKMYQYYKTNRNFIQYK